MVRTVGSREFKTRLGTYLRRVERGATYVVTDRGRPVAEVRPVATGVGEEERLAELVALGELTAATGRPLARFRRLRVEGPTVSQALREDREDRF